MKRKVLAFKMYYESLIIKILTLMKNDSEIIRHNELYIQLAYQYVSEDDR